MRSGWHPMSPKRLSIAGSEFSAASGMDETFWYELPEITGN